MKTRNQLAVGGHLWRRWWRGSVRRRRPCSLPDPPLTTAGDRLEQGQRGRLAGFLGNRRAVSARGCIDAVSRLLGGAAKNAKHDLVSTGHD